MHIIVQAGGKGTRLEGLTRNKPKCLVPFDNLPLIFHLFERFRGAKFSIIADYKIDVLQKYLAIFAKNYNYKIIHAKGSGTASGIAEAIEDFDENESFLVIWCDLILSREFKLPQSVDLAGQNANFGAGNLGENLALNLSENRGFENDGENLALNLGENSALNLGKNLSEFKNSDKNSRENLVVNLDLDKNLLDLNLSEISAKIK